MKETLEENVCGLKLACDEDISRSKAKEEGLQSSKHTWLHPKAGIEGYRFLGALVIRSRDHSPAVMEFIVRAEERTQGQAKTERARPRSLFPVEFPPH